MNRPTFKDHDHAECTNGTGAKLVFFDTEFTGLIVDPKLISIGCVDETGTKTFYAELSDTWTLGDLSEFARGAVLPRLEGGDVVMTMNELTLRLADWLEDFGGSIQLATDSLAWDWPWIREIFEPLDTWPRNLDGKPVLLLPNTVFNLAVENAFTKGLRRHHALDDAKANRLGWIAAGRDVEKM
jgi:hypothetical protein